MKNSIEITPLEWDSNFFEYPVGKVLVNNLLESDLTEFSTTDLKLIYIFSENKLDLNLFEDTKVYFAQNLDANILRLELNKKIEIFEDNHFEALIPLALATGVYSRFKLDNNFKNYEFERLYFTWILNSVNKKIADIIYLYKEANEIIGFVSIVIKETFCEIGLIGVTQAARGKGVGKALIHAAKLFTLKQNKNELRVPTQEINKEAMFFYQKTGFNILSKTYIYHFWNL